MAKMTLFPSHDFCPLQIHCQSERCDNGHNRSKSDRHKSPDQLYKLSILLIFPCIIGIDYALLQFLQPLPKHPHLVLKRQKRGAFQWLLSGVEVQI